LSSNSASLGGGVYNYGTLTVDGGAMTGNVADEGGAAFNGNVYYSPYYGVSGVPVGAATITACTFSGNSAIDGGAIENFGSLTVNNSTFSTNSATYGGALFNWFSGVVTLSGCTITGNNASGSGGGIYNNAYATLHILNQSNVTGNTSSAGDDDLYNLGNVDVSADSDVGVIRP
jgi:hypothetical protein